MKKENLIKEKSFEFAIEIIEVYKTLKDKREYVISKQLLRSGTSIGANVNESISAVSRKDFLNKLSIALKEARETEYWLRLILASRLIEIDLTSTLQNNEEIIRILTAITKSTKDNL